MRFRDTENKLMWERYMGDSTEETQLRHFNDQNTNPVRPPRAFKHSNLTTQPDVNTLYGDQNMGYGEEEAEDSYEGETIVLGLEPEGPVEIDNGFDLVPDDNDDDGFGDMMEDEPEEIDEVLYSDIKKLAEYSNRLLKDVDHAELETWMIAKIIKASEYVSDVWHRLDAKADFANTGVDQVEDDEFGM